MSDKRNDNHPKPDKARNPGLDTDLLDIGEGAGNDTPGRRNGGRESHHAGAQPRPVR